ncbi:unnamed protein product [Phaedon cochleariae]|uniref:Serine aminopeptidase S33 domain-containing protein n=1 Tax=Phaedon cochleariae TaxID=80249 RepID=A0A9P0GQY2_PHACE|nr:unnamed protein product [Phaedon cochleariae]
MANRYHRFDEYYLVSESDMENVEYDERSKQCCSRRCKMILILIFVVVLVLSFLFVFVVIPLVFMNSISLQRLLIFTRFNLPSKTKYFEEYKFPAFKNEYVTVQDYDSGTNKSLGVWHILPVEEGIKALNDSKFDYNLSLATSNYSVLIYFHGTGEVRSFSERKYQLLSFYFHVIAFDYRGYGDSSSGYLSEKTIVNDCVQLYGWIRNRTQSPIYIWGHSLGSAVAAETVATLKKKDESPSGLILESAFTSLEEELYVHPYGKIFAWLPWFKATILEPLHKNGFIFDTATNIGHITCPIMILHAEDDNEVPCKFGKKLYAIASERMKNGKYIPTIYHEFDSNLSYGHFFIYQDPFLKYYIMDFLTLAKNQSTYWWH